MVLSLCWYRRTEKWISEGSDDSKWMCDKMAVEIKKKNQRLIQLEGNQV